MGRGAGQGWGVGESSGAMGKEAWFAWLFSHLLCITHNREQVKFSSIAEAFALI